MRKNNKKQSEEKKFVFGTSAPKEIDIYMVVNPISGSREGTVYTELVEKEYFFEYDNIPTQSYTQASVCLHITNLLVPEEVERLKEDVHNTLVYKLSNNPNDKNSVIILT